MAIELNDNTKQLIASAVANGDFPDEETAVNALITEAFEDIVELRAEIEAACAELDEGHSISLEEWRAERARHRAAQGN